PLGDGPGLPAEGAPPVETLVEREGIQLERNGCAVNYRKRARAGARLERELYRRMAGASLAVIQTYRIAYSLELPSGEAVVEVDRATRRFVALMTGRVIDGLRALEAMGSADPPMVP